MIIDEATHLGKQRTIVLECIGDRLLRERELRFAPNVGGYIIHHSVYKTPEHVSTMKM